jgi:hypothetical protein
MTREEEPLRFRARPAAAPPVRSRRAKSSGEPERGGRRNELRGPRAARAGARKLPGEPEQGRNVNDLLAERAAAPASPGRRGGGGVRLAEYIP